MRGLRQMLGAGVLAAGLTGCPEPPRTGVECGTRLEEGDVKVVGKTDECREVAASIGPRIAEVLTTGKIQDAVEVVEDSQ